MKSRTVGVVLLVLALGGLSACESLAAPSDTDPGAVRAEKGDAGTVRAHRASAGRRDRDPRGADRARTHLVTRVVDGDTLEVGSGTDVRLVGIDTPEIGECGHEKASSALARLVLGKQVALTQPREDRDRYGRLLRYVDVGGLDAGLRLVEDGLAVARYDSRDGYGVHPREQRYVAADRGAPALRCARPRGFAAPAVGSACAPGYTPCVPPFPPDVDCADVDGPVQVSGTDPHGLDGDGDGTACE